MNEKTQKRYESSQKKSQESTPSKKITDGFIADEIDFLDKEDEEEKEEDKAASDQKENQPKEEEADQEKE